MRKLFNDRLAAVESEEEARQALLEGCLAAVWEREQEPYQRTRPNYVLVIPAGGTTYCEVYVKESVVIQPAFAALGWKATGGIIYDPAQPEVQCFVPGGSVEQIATLLAPVLAVSP